MSTLTSASTLTEIQAAYADNASYSEDNSPAKARAFVTACRLLILHLPKQSGAGGSNLAMNPELIRQELLAAQEWLTLHDTATTSTSSAGPRVTFGDFRSFR